MWIDARDSNGAGSKLTLADVTLPPDVGDGFARLYGSDDGPETAAEWVADVRDAIERAQDRSPTADDLCTTENGDHVFVGEAETRAYICVLDPLVYPFLTGEAGTIRSTTPVRGAEVTFEVGPDGTTVSHDDVLVSIGVSDGPEGNDEMSVGAVYREVCEYVQTFEDEGEYDDWAAEIGASTTAVPAEEGLAIARGLADALFDADADGEGGGCCPERTCC